MKKDKKMSRFNEILDIPKEIGTNKAKVTILGFEEILIENYNGILEYENYIIKINTHIGTININGTNLEIVKMTTDDIIINGKIDSIEFEEIENENN